jgi:hypothetical protein
MNIPSLPLPASGEITTSATSIMPNALAMCIFGRLTLPLLLPTALVYLLRLHHVSTTDRPSPVLTNATELAASAILIMLNTLAVGVLGCYALPLLLFFCFLYPHEQQHTSITSHSALAPQRSAKIITSLATSTTTKSTFKYASHLSSLLPYFSKPQIITPQRFQANDADSSVHPVLQVSRRSQALITTSASLAPAAASTGLHKPSSRLQPGHSTPKLNGRMP